jgi:RNA polymerase subunit RPABC4/transcription elongation factor Spt4
MKTFKLYVFYILFAQVDTSLLPTKKICRDCKHFIENNNIECRKFSDTDLITGKVTYHSAIDVRKNETKCGEDAVHFEENNFKIITVPYYFFKNNWLPNSLLILYIIYIYATIISP